MPVEHISVPDAYQDSVKLMRVASDVRAEFELEEAVAVMGTDENKRTLVESGLLEESSLVEAGPNDLLLAVRGADPDSAGDAIEWMRERARGSADRSAAPGTRERGPPRGLHAAIDQLPDADLALISVPGEYAAREAWKALHEGLHVHVFSDNVDVADEAALKAAGRERDRLVMGPDCGSAIIEGVPLGFANDVAEGSVGVVSAAGTGLQEATSLVDRAGAGISHAIGTGGRDLSEAVGGTTTEMGLELLADHDGTEVVLLVSKPPDAGPMSSVLAAVADCPKPVVVAFVGADPDPIEDAGATPAATLAAGAREAVRRLPGHGGTVSFEAGLDAFAEPDDAAAIAADLGDPGDDRRYLRGLFSGGTLAYEALVSLSERLGGVASNLRGGEPVADPLAPDGHAIVDLGADEFTRGRPHPMIAPALRNEQVTSALQGGEALVVLVDVVLGYGAHEDPAGALADVVAAAGSDGWPAVVASVCGTEGDPQRWAESVEGLADAGVHVAPTNADAAALAGGLLAEAGVADPAAAAGGGGDD